MDDLNLVNWLADGGRPGDGKEPLTPMDCPNCGEDMDKMYCPRCGQSRRDIRISFSSLIMDFLGDYFTFDSKLFRSLKPLFRRPGLLTMAFMQGKRASFIPPLRMYIFCSIIFFLTLTQLSSSVNTENQNEPEEAYTVTLVSALHKNLEGEKWQKFRRNLSRLERNSLLTGNSIEVRRLCDELTVMIDAEQLDKAAVEAHLASLAILVAQPPNPENMAAEERAGYNQLLDLQEKGFLTEDDVRRFLAHDRKNNINITDDDFDDDHWLGHWINEKVRAQHKKLGHMSNEQFTRAYFQAALSTLPKVMFLLMPLFAFLLKLTYIRRDPLYIDHLIFAFHFHSFMFLFYSLIFGMHMIPGESPTWLVVLTVFSVLGVPPIYLFFSLKRVYAQSLLKTLIKFSIIAAGYGAMLFVAMVGGLLISLFMV